MQLQCNILLIICISFRRLSKQLLIIDFPSMLFTVKYFLPNWDLLRTFIACISWVFEDIASFTLPNEPLPNYLIMWYSFIVFLPVKSLLLVILFVNFTLWGFAWLKFTNFICYY
jgi:hypothetical protein